MALGGSPQQPPPKVFFAIATLQNGTRGLAAAAAPRGVLRNCGFTKWHSGARPSSRPPRRSSQSQLYKMALGGSPQHPPPEAFFAIATLQNGTRGLAAAATPRGVLRNNNFTKWHSGARR